MQISTITQFLEEWAPKAYQESYDNSGLLIGSYQSKADKALVCLDVTEDVIDEAIREGCNLIIAHHPLIFSGLKSITGKNYVERCVIKAIKNDLAIYAIHTNLDNIYTGVNYMIAQKLGLNACEILDAKSGWLRKLSVFVPVAHIDSLLDALFEAGAGQVGAYDECSWKSVGEGTFRAGPGTDPFVGTIGERHFEPEAKIEVIFPFARQQAILAAMKEVHPYEEVAYDILKLDNEYAQTGSGYVGYLNRPMPVDEFIAHVKSSLKASVVRFTALSDTSRSISKVALCGGSGSFLLNKAISAGADAFITADFKYHQFFDAEGRIVIADIGHFESEQFTIDLIIDKLKENFPTFAVLKTSVNTNPISYA